MSVRQPLDSTMKRVITKHATRGSSVRVPPPLGTLLTSSLCGESLRSILAVITCIIGRLFLARLEVNSIFNVEISKPRFGVFHH